MRLIADAVRFVWETNQQTVAADAVRLVPAPAADGYYVHADHLGSPQAMTDDAQQEVWRIDTRPFGEVEALTWTVENNQRFPGQYADAESGYSYNYFRDYEPALGRYLQSDPIGLAGGINTFAYVGGNPLKFTDPLGLDVYVCTRPVALAWVPRWAAEKVVPDHHWILTDTYESGMGAACAVPGQQCSDVLYTQTVTKSHAGQSSTPGASCERQQNVNEECVNDLIAPGVATGTWTPVNQCISFAYSVVQKCRYGPQIGPELPPATYYERGALGSSYGP